MKLIYTCDNVNGKDVVPYTGVVEINQIIGRPTTIIGEANYGLVYRISVPLNTQYVNKSGMNFNRNENSGMTIATPYSGIVKISEFVEWKSYMSFYDVLMKAITNPSIMNKFPAWGLKEVNGELVIDVRNDKVQCWHYENWYANKKYSSGESKEYKPKRCSIKTVVSSIDE